VALRCSSQQSCAERFLEQDAVARTFDRTCSLKAGERPVEGLAGQTQFARDVLKRPRRLTAASASGAAVLSIDHEQKKFSGILRKFVRRSRAVPPPKVPRI
jgi:hypothetical protein